MRVRQAESIIETRGACAVGRFASLTSLRRKRGLEDRRIQHLGNERCPAVCIERLGKAKCAKAKSI